MKKVLRPAAMLVENAIVIVCRNQLKSNALVENCPSMKLTVRLNFW